MFHFHFLADKPFPVFRMTDPLQTTKNENDKLKTEDQRAGNFIASSYYRNFNRKIILQNFYDVHS